MNKPNFKVKMLSIFLTVLTTHAAWSDGGSDSGGGKGVVCYNPDSTIKSVELLEFWEARKLYPDIGEIPIDNSTPAIFQFRSALERLKNVLVVDEGHEVYQQNDSKVTTVYKSADVLAFEIAQVGERIFHSESYHNVMALRDVELELTQDSYEEAMPSSCKVKQLVRYKNAGLGGGEDRVLVNQDLINLMDQTNLAGLALHEGLYSYLRSKGERSSVRTRRAVSFVMKGKTFSPAQDLLKQYPRLDCKSPGEDASGFFFPQQTILHFVQVPMFAPIEVSMPGKTSSKGSQVKRKVISTMIVPVVEKIGGIPMMGLVMGYSGSVDSLEDWIKKFENYSNFSFAIGLSGSPVDFDFDAFAQMKQLKNKQLSGVINLVHSASGIKAPQKFKFVCDKNIKLPNMK